MSKLKIWGVGALIGLASFALSMAFIRIDLHGNMSEASSHDLQLANNLGFLFPPFVGFWAGVHRKSLFWCFVGVSAGLAIGSLYRLLCDYNFLAVMVTYPTLLGGVAAAALGGHGKSDWVKRSAVRFLKGLLAGFGLGFVYMFVLNVLALFLFPMLDTTLQSFRQLMWIAGTTAMVLSSGFYLVLFHWSAELNGRQTPKQAN